MNGEEEAEVSSQGAASSDETRSVEEAEVSNQKASVGGVVEPASSGRAKCRACGGKIERGALRFGEKLPNPFGEGEATYWFHLDCAAYRRPEPLLETLSALSEVVPDQERLMTIARPGAEHPRLARIARLERSPSGRARCRHCREAIPKEGWRLALEIFQEGRFDPIGFIHIACQREYFGIAAELERVLRAGKDLDQQALREVEAALVGS